MSWRWFLGRCTGPACWGDVRLFWYSEVPAAVLIRRLLLRCELPYVFVAVWCVSMAFRCCCFSDRLGLCVLVFPVSFGEPLACVLLLRFWLWSGSYFAGIWWFCYLVFLFLFLCCCFQERNMHLLIDGGLKGMKGKVGKSYLISHRNHKATIILLPFYFSKRSNIKRRREYISTTQWLFY